MTKSLPLTHDVGVFSPLRFRILAFGPLSFANTPADC